MRKKTACGLLAGIICLALAAMPFGCSGKDAAAYKKISPAEARALMDSGDPYVLLDVRTENEWQNRRIQGAILIPYTEIKTRAASELPDKDAVILVYCRSGRRSAIAAEELARMGYTRVYDFGGINDWPHGTVSGTNNAKE